MIARLRGAVLVPSERRLRGVPALIAGALGGVLLYLAFPAISLWPLVFPAVLLIIAAWWNQRPGVAVVVGLTAGATFWFPLLSFLTLYLGPVPWLGLASLMTLWFALQGVLTGIATRGLSLLSARGSLGGAEGGRLARLRVPSGVVTVLQVLSVTGIWVLREAVQGAWPYNGFAWGRLAHLMANAPWGPLASWVGFLGLTAIIVALCAAVVAAVAGGDARADAVAGGDARVDAVRRPRRTWRRVLAATAVAAVLFGLLAFVPPAGLEQTGSIRVAAVQGNSKSGIFDDRESGDVYADHVRGTEALLDKLEASGDRVDLIVWPENAAEFALNEHPLRGRELALLSRRAGAPIAVGTVLQDPDDTFTNSVLVWGQSGQEEPLEHSRYDKRYPVPFAEYMPNRPFFRSLAPELVDLVQLDYQHGERSPVLEISADKKSISAGIAICFDIIFDEQATKMVSDGAQVILSPTNNADFGHTDESAQQLQITRLRAIETGRSIVNISTVGLSEVIAPDGTQLASIRAFTGDSMVANVPLVTGETPAIRFGGVIAGLWIAIGLVATGTGSAALLRRRRAAARTKQL